MTLGATIAGAIISGLFNSASSAFSSHQQLNNQSKLNKDAYKYSLKLQNHQNQFTQSMFNQSASLSARAHQIEQADLKSAGLNPILTATGGNGATVVSPMSGGSASMSGGSAQSVDPAKIDLINAYSTAKQIKNDTQRVENETDQLPYIKDNLHHQANLNRETAQKIGIENELLNKYGDLIENEKYLSFKNQNAKTVQDIINSQRLTDSQIAVNNSAIALNESTKKYTNERARGYSESYSESDSIDKGIGESYGSIGTSVGLKGVSVSTPSRTSKRNNARSKSRSYSRSW